jgi:hypothetical protein
VRHLVGAGAQGPLTTPSAAMHSARRFAAERAERYSTWAQQRGVNLSLAEVQREPAFSSDLVLPQCNVYVNHR